MRARKNNDKTVWQAWPEVSWQRTNERGWPTLASLALLLWCVFLSHERNNLFLEPVVRA